MKWQIGISTIDVEMISIDGVIVGCSSPSIITIACGSQWASSKVCQPATGKNLERGAPDGVAEPASVVIRRVVIRVVIIEIIYTINVNGWGFGPINAINANASQRIVT